MKTTTTTILATLWFGFFALVLGAQQKNEEDVYAGLMRNRKFCSQQANLTDADFDIIMNLELYKPKTRTSTPKRMQCYSKCYMEQTKLYINGEINTKFIYDTLQVHINSKEKAQAALDKCGKLVGADECEKCFNFMICLVEETGIYS